MYEMYMKRFGDGKNYITVQFGKVKNVYLIETFCNSVNSVKKD